MDDLAGLAGEPYCYLTTVGRASGRPHTVEVWFATRDRSPLYLLSGGGDRSDWVRNLRREPNVTVRVGRRDRPERPGRARILAPATPEDALARRLLYDKYQAGYRGDLTRWRERSLPVAIDL